MQDSKDSVESKWKRYSVSKLNPTSSSVDSLPVITIRPRRNDIFIPSVHKSEEVVTPRTADSNSADGGSNYSSLSRKLQSGHGSRGSSRGKTTRIGSPFKHPVTASRGGGIGVEVGDENLEFLVPNTKLDILEAFLPRDLRNPHKFKTQMHNKMRVSALVDGQHKINHVSRLLQREQIHPKDYKPVHYSSGGLSVDTYQTTEDLDSLADSQFTAESQVGELPSPLVSPTAAMTKQLSKRLTDSPPSAKDLLAAAVEERDTFKLDAPYEGPAIGTTTNRKGGLASTLRQTALGAATATGAVAAPSATYNNDRRRSSLWVSEGKNRELLIDREERLTMNNFMADLERSLKQHQEEEERKQQQERDVILQLKVVNTLFDKNYSLAGALIATAQRLESEDQQRAIEDAIKRSAELEHSLATRYHMASSEAREKGEGDDDDSQDSFDENDEQAYQKRLHERAMARAVHALQLSDGQSERFKDKMAELTNRKMKDKLKHLAKYINSHTSRKILDCWNVIEGRFKSSNFTKVVMTTNSSGLTHPVKHPALFVSTLTCLLCSAKVKVGHAELMVLMDRLGIAPDEVFHARQIAALNLVISYDTECKLKETLGYKVDLQVLMRKEEKLIALHELMQVVFPKDEEEKQKELEIIKNNRQAEIQAVMDEKKKKEEKKEALERRRKQLIHDFETCLDQYQIMKGRFTRDRHNEFVSLINHCVRTIAQHYENESAKISLDVMSFIGFDAFPIAIQNKMNKKKAAAVAGFKESKENPLLRKNLMPRNAGLTINLPSEGSHTSTIAVPTGDPTMTTTARPMSSSAAQHAIAVATKEGSSRIGSPKNINSGSSTPPHSSESNIRPSARLLGTLAAASAALKPQSARNAGGAATPTGGNEVVMPVSKALEAVKAVVMAPERWEPLKLYGPPTVVAILRETISFGKGLNGYPYRDVVACLQYVAVTKITAFFRGHSKNWRYRYARQKWRKIDADIRKSHFLAWKIISLHNVNTNKYCFRKLKAWQFYTRRAIYRRNVFRQCFWMFYTWKKYSDASATAKEKAFFLVHRVMPTVLKIKIFRAWKRYTKVEVKLNKAADKYCASLLHKRYKESFYFFYDWFRRRRHIRKSWFRRGAAMRKLNLYRTRIAPFLLWLIYAKYRKIVRNRVKSQFYDMKRALLHSRHPIRALSYIEQRMLFVRKKIQGAAKAKMAKKRAKKEVKKPTSSQGSKPGSSSAQRKSVTPNSRMKPKPQRRPSLSKQPASGSALDSDTGGGTAESAVESTDDEASLSKPSTADGSNTTAATGEEAAPGNKLKVLRRPFNWKADTSEIYDIDSEGEDNEDLGSKMVHCYRHIASEHPPLQDPMQFEFIERAEFYIQQKAKLYHEIYNYCDVWNTFEAAVRFHRVAFRAFNNLRQYARIRHRVRKHAKKVRLGTLKSYFQMLKVNAKYVARRLANTSLTEAEQINSDVRMHMVGKLNRLRQTTELVNQVLGRDTGDVELDDEARAIQKMKYLNMIAEDNDEEYMAAELKRRKENQAEAKRKADLLKNNTQLPNLLEYDRADREKEEHYAQIMLYYGKESKRIGLMTTEQADQQSKEKMERHNKVIEVVNAQLDFETNVTSNAIGNQETFVNLFKVHAADCLITALAKIYVEVQMNLMREETRLYFRALRVPMLLTRSRSMYRRKKLMNWIRICHRLNSIDRNAKYYAEKRCLWVTLNRWLKYLEIEKLNPTPGLSNYVRRKLLLHPGFNDLLEKKGFMKVPYYNNERLQHTVSEFGALFIRWKTETQESILFRLLSQKIHDLYILKLKQKIFYALKTGFHIKEIIRLIKNDPPLFPMVRMLADVSIIGRKFLSQRKKTVNATIAKYNRKFVHKLKIEGKAAMSFKKFMFGFENETSQRISSEQRILSESFEQRGKQEFFDLRCPARNDPQVPPIMSKLDGKPFSDPQYIASDGKDITIPGGFRLHKLKFVLQSGLGVVGWQCIWSADGARDIEGPQRGNWNCSAMSTQEFTVPKEDYISGLEYMYDGGTIVAVRLKYLNHGFTSWVGSKGSLSTLSVYLGHEIAPKLLFEEDRDKYLDPEEVATPAYPSNFVIGLTGITNGGRATCLGLVVRKIKRQNIFSYYYVGDVLAKVNAHQNDYAMTMQKPKKRGENHSHDGSSVAGSHGGDDGSVNSSAKDSLADTKSQMSEDQSSQHTAGDTDDSDSDSEATGGKDDGTDGTKTGDIRAEEIALLGKRRHGVLKQRTDDEPLTRSEEEFFDVLRMRTTELSDAVEKVVEFARRLWTSKEIRNNPQLNKLINIRIISHLSQWYFNTLSKRLIKVSHTERQALQLQKTARQYHFQAVKLARRAESTAILAKQLERTKQPWSGKSMLGPVERAAKKEHLAKVKELKDLSEKYENESFEMRQNVVEYEKEAYALLPRIPLSLYVFNNYKVKIQAARHKASLLERMTLDDIKSGLFGTDTKDNLLNKEQMNAIHASLMNQKIVLKDDTSLGQLIEDVLAEEGAILDQEHAEMRRQHQSALGLSGRGNRGYTMSRHASLTSASQSLSLGSAGVLNAGSLLDGEADTGGGSVSGIALEGSMSLKHNSSHGHHHHNAHHSAHHHHQHHGKQHHHHAGGGHVHHKIKHTPHHHHHGQKKKPESPPHIDHVADAAVALITNGDSAEDRLNNRERSLTLNSVETEITGPEGLTLPPRGGYKASAVTAVHANRHAKQQAPVSVHHSTTTSGSGAKKMMGVAAGVQLSKSAKY